MIPDLWIRQQGKSAFEVCRWVDGEPDILFKTVDFCEAVDYTRLVEPYIKVMKELKELIDEGF
jgi:hypothetical protein